MVIPKDNLLELPLCKTAAWQLREQFQDVVISKNVFLRKELFVNELISASSGVTWITVNFVQ